MIPCPIFNLYMQGLPLVVCGRSRRSLGWEYGHSAAQDCCQGPSAHRYAVNVWHYHGCVHSPRYGLGKKGDPAMEDIVDETLTLFRANCFFRNFEIKGPSDRVLIYLTLFLQECLGKLSLKSPSLLEAQKLLLTHALQTFPLPGDAQFPLNSLFEKPANRADGGEKFALCYTLDKVLIEKNRPSQSLSLSSAPGARQSLPRQGLR